MSRDQTRGFEDTFVDGATGAESNVLENEWWYLIGSRQIGPVAKAEVASQITSLRLSPSSLVWRNGLSSWVKLSEVDDFSDLLRQRVESDREPSTREAARATAPLQAKPADAPAGAPRPETPKQAANVTEPQNAQPAFIAGNAPKPGMAGAAERQQSEPDPLASPNECPMPKAFRFLTERKEAEQVSPGD